MTAKSLILAATVLASTCVSARQHFSFLGTTILLEDSLGAAMANSKGDAYTASHTPFDRAIRLQTQAPTTERDYLSLAAKSMRNWNSEESATIKSSFAALEDKAQQLKLRIPLPDTIVMCKTTAEEEFGAEGYTRGNRIMLHAALDELSPALLSHELWHVVSRLDPALRNSAYANFGFRPCNRIDYKPAFNGQVISNPDCPFLEHFISIQKDGRPVDVTLVLYSRVPFIQGGGLMQYAAVGLLALEGDGMHKRAVVRNGKPVVYEFQGSDDFFRQTGHNTGYMLHVEELTAEHFSALLTGRKMKQMEFVNALAKELR